MAHHQLIEATHTDILQVVLNLCLEDTVEAAAWGMEGRQAALDMVNRTPQVWAWQIDEIAVALVGVAPSAEDPTTGHPWVLRTPAARAFWKVQAKEAPGLLKSLGAAFDRLVVYKHSWLTGHLRWLKQLGFEVVATVATIAILQRDLS